MKILFFAINEFDPMHGGVERVSCDLGNYFVKESQQVLYLSVFGKINSVAIYALPFSKKILSFQNKNFIRDFLEYQKIDLVINQSSFSLSASQLLLSASKSLNIPVISVFHSAPNCHNLHFDNHIKISKSYKKPLFKIFIPILKSYYNYIDHMTFKYVYDNSRCCSLLSKSYFDSFKKIIGEKTLPKLIAMHNPTGFKATDNCEKKNRVLCIGRLHNSKRVDKVISSWINILDRIEGDWELIIAGDGPEYERMVHDNKISSIKFVGKVNPLEYYKSSKIFCMASSYEGLPMTLIESIQFGVVPIVLNTFEAVHDVIDGSNGFIVENMSEFEDSLLMLINNPQLRFQMSLNAKESSSKFSIATIGQQWLQLFSNILAK